MKRDGALFLAAALFGLGAATCGSESITDDETGGASGVGGSPAASGAVGVEPTLARVTHITSTSCALPGCHAAPTTHIELGATGLRDRLLGTAPDTASDLCRDRPLVVPGEPDDSLIVQKIEPDDAPRAGCGNRMPNGCAAMPTPQRPCLEEDDIASIRGWIAEGAPE